MSQSVFFGDKNLRNFPDGSAVVGLHVERFLIM